MADTTSAVRCVICRHTPLNRVTVNHSFGVDVLQCPSCTFIQTEPVSDAALKRYYSEFYRGEWTAEIVEAVRDKSRAQAAAQVAFIEEVLGPSQFEAALDYGTADGELPRRLSLLCDDLYATEEDPLYRELLAKEPSITLLEEDELRGDEHRGRFDLITISHVLEHLPDPGAALGLFAALLKPGGALLIDVPHEIEMLKHGAQGLGHLHYFTPDLLKMLVDRDGLFEVLEIRRCNRSVADFVASRFSMPEDHSIAEHPDGSVIRALLRNKGHELAVPQVTAAELDHRQLWSDYSERILELHHRKS